MNNFVDYFEENEISELSSINFENPEIGFDVDFKINDHIEIIDVNDKMLTIEFTRSLIELDLDELFLEISVLITFKVKKEFDNTIVFLSKIKQEDLKKVILENEDFFLSCSICTVSLLISQILSAFGRIPPITPPLFIKE
ncbi:MULTISPECIES: hypothetical protein [Anaerofustis]|uniref:hypothetical protein n=1 Tax=Anaerofustis TaxID=264995 RepID=UPI001106738C|nr:MULTISPECIES: hypothetical protein [Anaerofustis]MCO8193417.1 hypothetical protein [Anaerofustis sp. NSJ-163]